MAKPKTIYACTECGAQHPKWLGRCNECGKWGSLEEEVASSKPPGLDQIPGEARDLLGLGGPARVEAEKVRTLGDIEP